MYKEFLRKYAWLYVPGAALLVLYSRLATRIPKLLGEATDLLEGGAGFEAVVEKAISIALISLISMFVLFGYRACIVGNARRLECSVRDAYFRKLQSLPVSFFAKNRSGDLIAYAINDLNGLRMLFGMVLVMLLRGISTTVFSLISMIGEVDGEMTLLALIPLPFALVAVIILSGAVRRRLTHAQKLFARMSGFVNESIAGAKVIKSFSREDQWEEKYSELSHELHDANIAYVKFSSMINPAITVAFGISYAVSLIFGGRLALQGVISVGDLVAYLGYLTLIRAPIMQIGRVINEIQRGVVSHKRLKEIFDIESVPEKEMIDERIDFEDKIEVKELTFSYEGQPSPALDRLCMVIEKGKTVGITGPTGCGKTTLVSLLLKLYDPPRGSVFVDGKDICDLPAYSMRKVIGYVAQDGFLFSDTVTGNIAFYSEKANEDTVKAAAHIANIDGEAASFPSGFDTEVGERGTRISGGQKQRIALARALIREPDILILDDTLSAVDNITGKTIRERLSTLTKTRTSIVISQNLSAIEDADCIYYMDNGRITEKGTHKELLELDGEYAALWRKQQAKEEKK